MLLRSAIGLLASQLALVSAYTLGAARKGGSVSTQLAATAPKLAVTQPPAPLARLRMQVETDEAGSSSIYDEFMGLDANGAAVPIGLDEKEKLYLDCLDAYYNEDGKSLLSNEKYEQLKVDIEFSESKVMTYSKDEIRYLLGNKRYKMGKPIFTDAEYDALRLKLKKAGSAVALHDSPTCKVDTGVCKSDLRLDKGKTRLLYLPGLLGGLVVFCEASFWTLHIDPLLSIVLGIVPVYFFGQWFTQNIFAQKPLVTTAPCPQCSSLMTVYFGDLFSVQTDGLIGQPTPPQSQIDVVCAQCKQTIVADRDQMILSTLPKI